LERERRETEEWVSKVSREVNAREQEERKQLRLAVSKKYINRGFVTCLEGVDQTRGSAVTISLPGEAGDLSVGCTGCQAYLIGSEVFHRVNCPALAALSQQVIDEDMRLQEKAEEPIKELLKKPMICLAFISSIYMFIFVIFVFAAEKQFTITFVSGAISCLSSLAVAMMMLARRYWRTCFLAIILSLIMALPSIRACGFSIPYICLILWAIKTLKDPQVIAIFK